MYKFRGFSFLGLLGVIFLMSSCSSSNSSTIVGNWIIRGELDGNARSEAVSFVINDTAYLTTGNDNTNTSSQTLDTFFTTYRPGRLIDSLGKYCDLWKYTPPQTQNSGDVGEWTQKADFIGSARGSAIAFAIGDSGYVGTGYDGTNMLNDFYGYDAATNKWVVESSIGSAGCSPRYDAVGFAIAGKGYVATGYDGGYKKDCYQYTPGKGWVQFSDFPGTKRSAAAVFVSKNNAYICTGSNNGNTAIVNDLWELNGSTLKWTQKRSISNVSTESFDDLYNIVRQNAVGFCIDNVLGDTTQANEYGYIATGSNGATQTDVWQYDIVNDLWHQKQSYERAPREGAVGFTINGRGFIGTGRSGTAEFDNFDEFLPLQAYNSLD